MASRLLLGLLFGALVFAGPALAETPKVVATTKPIHSLVAAVMGDLGTPAMLVKGSASPHSYSLKPSDAAALEQADVVFWTGPGMELFLEDALATLAPDATTIDLSQTPSLQLLPPREGGAFEPHEHEDEHGHEHEDEHEHEGEHSHDHEGEHDHDHGAPEVDMHYWLDPANAIHMVGHIAETLIAADPANADTYADNATAAVDDLLALRSELQGMLDPLADGRFILFHDATHYFENSFALRAVGSLTVTPDARPGAQRVAELRKRIAERGASCVFAEPNFDPAIVTTLIEGTDARAGTIDPEGTTLTEGPGLYRDLLTGLAQSFADCLAR
jgi:zinc transport system substrate-binding protein